MSAPLATMNVCGAEAGATAMDASRSFPAAINDDQRGPRTDDATSAHNHFQFAGADAPRQRPVRFSSSLRTGHPIHAVRLPAGRHQSFSDQLRSQIVAAPVIHHLCLSPTRLDCINAIEKELTRGTEALSPDDKIHD